MTSRFSPFTETLWYATAAPAPKTTEFEGRIQADVCIVGAGYTGLTTSLELALKGVKVVLLEAQEAGFGGSGRNAGHCTPTFTHYSLPDIRKVLGEPWAERLIHRQTRANDRVSGMIERYQIQCEWQQNGYVQAAHRTCSFPHCRRPAADTDLDHLMAWPHGPTDPMNLHPLCRRHHRAKQAVFTVVRLDDGTTRWITRGGWWFDRPPPTY